jgi:hypothetical protein
VEGVEVILGHLGPNVECHDTGIVGGGERSDDDVGKLVVGETFPQTCQLLTQVEELLEVGPYDLVLSAPLIE